MNVVREISRINEQELDIALKNPKASWHEQYKDSAYIFIGGLNYDLTEGDVITIFSQYGEVVDINLPRGGAPPPNAQDVKGGGESSSAQSDQQQRKPPGKGKHRGFGFLMYEDQRSTVLAVDNLNGAVILGRTIRVDHVSKYKQPKEIGENGEKVEAQVQSMNAKPEMINDTDEGSAAESEIDEEDPMAAYLRSQQKKEKEKGREGVLTKEERREMKLEKLKRKEERARIREERSRRKGDKGKGRSLRDDASSRERHSRRNPDDDDDEGIDQGRNRYEEMRRARERESGPASRERRGWDGEKGSGSNSLHEGGRDKSPRRDRRESDWYPDRRTRDDHLQDWRRDEVNEDGSRNREYDRERERDENRYRHHHRRDHDHYERPGKEPPRRS
ncbi:RNA-binding domain-containing protein [Violaceomyces palustris]|uniref:RNA-binding domain-containing protein n=1 Tax=Violaceomyces palustris TaxID=1673888 RepID=A0ACD0P894_9BASI|nr:RNA-binding domain-containing protein [Violaceomyces palustris]